MRIAFFGDSLTEGVPGSSYVAILRARLPGHTLLNLGRGNETVVSLYRRIARLRFAAPLDLAFLWVGVNDLPGRDSWSFRIANALLRKPRARSPDEFRAYYQATLDLLCRHAQRVVAVPPLLKGEDVDGEPNRKLETLARAIEKSAAHCEQAEYLDLRPLFARQLAGKPISGYLPRSALRVALDALTLRGNARVDSKAAARGLHVTLDGVHLNSAGAKLVADAFAAVIGRST